VKSEIVKTVLISLGVGAISAVLAFTNASKKLNKKEKITFEKRASTSWS
jgi:hypothetical protein